MQISVGAQIHQTCYAPGSLAGTWPRVRLGWTTSGPPPGSGSESLGWTTSGPPPSPPRGGPLPRPARPPLPAERTRPEPRPQPTPPPQPPTPRRPKTAGRRGSAGAVAVQPVTAQDPAARRGRHPRSAPTPTHRRLALRPQPADPPARFAPPAWEKPRQRTTDRRRQTAARIDDNPNSPSGGPQPLPAAEATAGLVAVAMTKAVLPGDAGLHRQSTPSGCPCGRRGQPQVTGSERFDDRTIAPKTISPPSGRSRAAALNSEICSLTLASTCHA